MSKIQWLRVFLNERLIAAAEEIFGAVEKTIAEEVSRSKEENGRLQRLLDITLLKLHRADMLQQISQEDVPPDQQDCVQEWIPSLGQKDLEPKQIKEEQEEHRTSRWEEQLKDDMKNSILTPTFMERDSEISALPSHLYQAQNHGEEESFLPSTSTAHIKTETCGEDYTVSETTSDSQHISTGNPYCSAAQSKNTEGMGIGGALSRSTPIRSKKMLATKGQKSLKFRKNPDLSNLKSHRQSDNTPCRCKVCGKAFQYMGSLMKHVQTHTREKEHICGVCGKCFESTESTKHHIQTHIADRMCCHICSKCFTSNRDLIVHMRTHTGEKPYICSECGKEFSVRNSLKRHMKIHAGSKGYCCSHCDKSFSSSFCLTFHMRSHRVPFM
ncbi:zinc finger and SCAN domain-containing protein 21-like [Esox lucius]|uniref:C2H2-type domain-containing protein n=1 Tax=Esox lucius TaxID=8010 RepID=A0AAY5KUP3_ESOLU|nr:zinc finger and SCAN domain-containing protein 21-like [Esox lucius]